MNITEHINTVEKVILERNSSFEHTSKEINELFERLLTEVAPKNEIEAAKKFVDSWINEFQTDFEKKFKLFDEHLDYANDLIQNTKESNNITDVILNNLQQFLSEYKKLGGINDISKNPDIMDQLLKKHDPKKLPQPLEFDENKKPKEPIEKVYDFENINNLVKQSPFVFRLEHFIKKANKSLTQSKLSFNLLHWSLKLRKAILVVIGILLTVYIDEFFGKQIKEFIKIQFALDVKPILFSILSSLFCIFTLERILERIKDNTFWSYADSATRKTRDTFNEFNLLKEEFNIIVEGYSIQNK